MIEQGIAADSIEPELNGKISSHFHSAISNYYEQFNSLAISNWINVFGHLINANVSERTILFEWSQSGTISPTWMYRNEFALVMMKIDIKMRFEY